jgi:hypothetical protein
MKTFTKQFIRENSGCYAKDKGIDFVNALDFMAAAEESDEIPYTWILESSIPTKDKYWFFCKKVFTKEQNQQAAIWCAWIVLEIFENKYPNDDRPRKAIIAVEQYIEGLIDREALIEARRNAYDAYADADAAAYAAAAYAAYAAAAAYAAYAAAAAYAAYAAYAAAAYAYAAYAAYAAAYADAATSQEALLLFLTQFCNENL